MVVAVLVAEQCAERGLGLNWASFVVLAELLDDVKVATLDERHFRPVRALAGGAAFRLLSQER